MSLRQLNDQVHEMSDLEYAQRIAHETYSHLEVSDMGGGCICISNKGHNHRQVWWALAFPDMVELTVLKETGYYTGIAYRPATWSANGRPFDMWELMETAHHLIGL